MAWFIIDTVLIGLSVIFFAISAFKDPGYLKRPKNVSFLVILLSYYTIIHNSNFYKTLIQSCYVQTVKLSGLNDHVIAVFATNVLKGLITIVPGLTTVLG